MAITNAEKDKQNRAARAKGEPLPFPGRARALRALRSPRAEAQRITQKEQQPYIAAADVAAADAGLIMTPEQIAAKYGANYDAAGDIAATLASSTEANAANATSMLSGIVGSLPGAGSYDTTSLLAGFTDANTSNKILGAKYAGSLAADIGAAAIAGIAMAEGRAEERKDRLRAEERELRLKGDIAGANYLTNLSNILNIRSQRQNLALSRFQLEQAKRDEKRRGSGSSSSGGTVTSDKETDKERLARLKREAEALRKQFAKATQVGGSAIYSHSNTVEGGLPGISDNPYNS